MLTGLVICAAGLLIPAHRDLADLRGKLDRLRYEERTSNLRLEAHENFLQDLEHDDAQLVRRLAAAQLNLMPQGDRPVLLSSSARAPVTAWIDASVQPSPYVEQRIPPSTLSAMATGPHRLWMLAFGVICVFVGLLLDPAVSQPRATAIDGRAAGRADPPGASAAGAALALLDTSDPGVLPPPDHDRLLAEQSTEAFNMAAASGALIIDAPRWAAAVADHDDATDAWAHDQPEPVDVTIGRLDLAPADESASASPPSAAVIDERGWAANQPALEPRSTADVADGESAPLDVAAEVQAAIGFESADDLPTMNPAPPLKEREPTRATAPDEHEGPPAPEVDAAAGAPHPPVTIEILHDTIERLIDRTEADAPTAADDLPATADGDQQSCGNPAW